jgi:fructokinase
MLWDVFPDGAQFGGAPANFACHAATFGGRAAMVSRVGEDDWGTRALEILAQRGVITEHVARDAQHPTGTVQVALDAAGKPTFTIAENVAWDHLAWSAGLETVAQDAGAVCFGTLGQRCDESRETIQRFIRATPPSTLRIYDINLRPPFYNDRLILESVELANVLKLNDDELPHLGSLCGLSGSDRELMRQLADRFGLECIALTRGAEGAVLLRGEQINEHPGVPADVVDTVGAGDSYTAALATGLLRGLELERINQTACRVAAYVCSRAGATPELPADLVGALA